MRCRQARRCAVEGSEQPVSKRLSPGRQEPGGEPFHHGPSRQDVALRSKAVAHERRGVVEALQSGERGRAAIERDEAKLALFPKWVAVQQPIDPVRRGRARF